MMPSLVHNAYSRRHIGIDEQSRHEMLSTIGLNSLEALVERIVPLAIRDAGDDGDISAVGDALSEAEALATLAEIAQHNRVLRSYIGMGYYGTHTPSVIARNVLENPAWYTAYTPYQAEISQGRLSLLLYFQQMVIDLTGLPVANASLLDEATAAAEAMTLCRRANKHGDDVLLVDADTHPQTIAVLRTRAAPVGITVVVTDDITAALQTHKPFAIVLSYPGSSGRVADISSLVADAHAHEVLVIAATDLLACALLTSPGRHGVDVAIGTSQRFGVPMGYGGPHAAFIAARDEMKRLLPGRIIGISKDAHDRPALRMALQTREQHIRRDKATSNICTAQALLAMMATLYAIYHGPNGIRAIAMHAHQMAAMLARGLRTAGVTIVHDSFFDTVTARVADADAAVARAATAGINIRRIDATHVGIACDETSTIDAVCTVVAAVADRHVDDTLSPIVDECIVPDTLKRDVDYLTHPVFSSYHSETAMMRFLRRLSEKDIALNRAMIPLGSCTMKLNAASAMLPISWPQFAQMHPYAPRQQAAGYTALIADLEQRLCALTGFTACSLQPNAGAQGEYAGLLAIRAWHHARGNTARHVCLIPRSAHGTNPASAVMAGMRVIVVDCDDNGNIDLADLERKAVEHADTLAAVMVTYPSTHGVFEQGIVRLCEIVHQYGGQVYLDGANLNALLGLARPGVFGADVCHINLHKTFAIPHGGGGPGVGPIAVAAHLAPYLPRLSPDDDGLRPLVSAAPFGSAGILPISWMYIRMMGADGHRAATQHAILSANYVARSLADCFPILYSGSGGLVAHECIIDLRPLKAATGVSEEDVAKRLIDYGFHAPTMSFPVAGTLMIEPTESENKAELDCFIAAMRAIYQEAQAIANGEISYQDSPLAHAPHTLAVVTDDNWQRHYSRAQAAFPLPSLRDEKYWPPVGRVDNVYGDRHLQCSCPTPDAYA